MIVESSQISITPETLAAILIMRDTLAWCYCSVITPLDMSRGSYVAHPGVFCALLQT